MARNSDLSTIRCKKLFFVITGKKGTGKSTFLFSLSEVLKDKYKVSGLITQGQEKRSFLDLETGQHCNIFKVGDLIAKKIGKYVFSQKSLDFGNRAITRSLSSDIIIIDELGILESKKEGLYTSTHEVVKMIKKSSKQCVILSIREDVKDKILNLLAIVPKGILEIKKYQSKRTLEKFCINIDEYLK